MRYGKPELALAGTATKLVLGQPEERPVDDNGGPTPPNPPFDIYTTEVPLDLE